MFASCSVDKTIGTSDTCLGKSPATSIKAHNADVNIISWNRYLYYSRSSFQRSSCLQYIDDLTHYILYLEQAGKLYAGFRK